MIVTTRFKRKPGNVVRFRTVYQVVVDGELIIDVCLRGNRTIINKAAR